MALAGTIAYSVSESPWGTGRAYEEAQGEDLKGGASLQKDEYCDDHDASGKSLQGEQGGEVDVVRGDVGF